MRSFTVERVIAAAAEDVFDWLLDASNYTKAPLVLRARRVRDGEGAPYGRGAIREITAAGAWFREEITLHERPREFRYVIVKSVPVFEHEGGGLLFEDCGGRTRVSWSTRYEVPTLWGGRPMAALMEPLPRRSLTTLLASAAAALEARPGGAGPGARAHWPFAVYTIPVLYRRRGETVEVPVESPARKRWWRNLRDEAPVVLLLRGRLLEGRAVAHERD